MKNFIKKLFCFYVASLIALSSTAVNAKTIVYAKTESSTYSSDAQCIIKDPHNILNTEQKEFIKNVFNDVFKKMWDKYGYSNECPVITFIIDSNLIVDGASAVEIGNGRIAFRENNFSRLNGYAVDLIVHELTHIVQEYQNTKTFSWLTEGIADYIAAEYSEHKRSLIPKQYNGGSLYSGYLTTAGFLIWLEEDKDYTDIVMKLHRCMQEGKIQNETFEILTGQSLSDLWKEYSGETLPSIENYLLSQSNLANITKLADYYFYGYGGEPDYTKALEYYQKAVEFGKTEGYTNYAIRRIADYYYYGYLDEKDYQKAYKLYNKVVASETTNSAYASNIMGDMVLNGYIEDMPLQQAISNYKYAIKLDEKIGVLTSQSIRAMMSLGNLFYKEKDPEAVIWYKKAEELGNFHAKNMLGYFYFKGELVEKDIQKACVYFTEVFENESASESNKRTAAINLADLFYEEKDPKAVIWYERASELGNFYAKNMLGYIYLNGELVEKDMKKAYSYFKDVTENTDDSESQKEYAQKMLDKYF